MGHGISLGVVVGFVGEEKDGWRAEDKAVAQVPSEQLLEGLGAVLALPEDGFVEGRHRINMTEAKGTFSSAPVEASAVLITQLVDAGTNELSWPTIRVTAVAVAPAAKPESA